MKSLLITFVFLSVQVGAQDFFQRTYGGTGSEFGRGVVQTSDGGYACVGATNSYGDGSSNVYLIKVDELGNYLWGRNLGGWGTIEWGMDIVEDSEGNLIIAGHTNETQNGDYNGLAIKMTAEGETVWYKTFGADDWDFFETLDVDSENSIYLVGNTHRDNEQKGWIVKLTNEGDEIWEEVLDGSGKIYVTGVSICDDENISFVGYTEELITDSHAFISGVAGSEGNMKWVSSESSWGNITTGKCKCRDNIVFTIGTFMSELESNFYLVKQGVEFGNTISNASIESALNFFGESIDLTPNGDIVLTGAGEFIFFEGFDAYVLKTNPSGGYISDDYNDTFGQSGYDYFFDVFATSDGGYISVGTSDSHGNGDQLFLVKIASNGDVDPNNEDFLDLPTNTPFREYGRLEIYPNPTIGTISIKSERYINSISICNAQGEILRNIETKNNNPERIDLSGLENGMYFLRLDYLNGSTSTHKIIKH